MDSLTFVAYITPVPQGSMRGFPMKRKDGTVGVALTSDRKDLKPYRHTLAQLAAESMANRGLELPYAPKHVPVEVYLTFVLAKPPSAPKSRKWPAVKPDIDKLERATFDALKGIAWLDDGQPCRVIKEKIYGTPERVEVTVSIIERLPGVLAL